MRVREGEDVRVAEAVAAEVAPRDPDVVQRRVGPELRSAVGELRARVEGSAPVPVASTADERVHIDGGCVYM